MGEEQAAGHPTNRAQGQAWYQAWAGWPCTQEQSFPTRPSVRELQPLPFGALFRSRLSYLRGGPG